MDPPPDEETLRRFRAAAGEGAPETKYALHKFHNIDQYYSSISTFETTFIPVSIDEASAIVATYRYTYRLKGPYPTPEQIQGLRNLSQRLGDQIRQYNGAFVRLSRRSPKDAIYECPVLLGRAKKALLAELSTLQSPTHNDEMLALFHAMGGALQVQSGEEALDMLTHSERVFVDLLLALDFPRLWSVKAAVRKWTNMPIEAEFRAFIHKGQLTAICQYCDICYFPLVVEHKQRIQGRIVALFEQMKSKNTLPFQDCVMDFACLPEQTLVIEINPYLESTGAALFDWKRDKQVLENGPLEFRLLERVPAHNFEGFVSDEWAAMLAEAKAELQKQRAQPPPRAVTPSDVTPALPKICVIS